jgi:hypothetical protein
MQGQQNLNFPAVPEVEGSLLYLKEAATGFCPKS